MCKNTKTHKNKTRILGLGFLQFQAMMKEANSETGPEP